MMTWNKFNFNNFLNVPNWYINAKISYFPALIVKTLVSLESKLELKEFRQVDLVHVVKQKC